jgi:hypothetical protein
MVLKPTNFTKGEKMKLGTIKALVARDKDGAIVLEAGKPVFRKGRYDFFVPVKAGETRTITLTQDTKLSARTPAEYYGDLIKYAKTDEKRAELQAQLAAVDPSVQLIVDIYEAKK